MGDCAPYTGPLEPLDVPLEGAHGPDWNVNNYVDLDPGPGVRDYTDRIGAAARTYDGHIGTDFAIATFRDMDRGVPVHAIAAGTVLETVDGNFDHNTTCTGSPNSVVVLLDDGTVLLYLHLRRSSIPTALTSAPSARVSPGDVVGLVGSSGCSTWPHVHIELHAADGTVIDPAGTCRFRETLPYLVPFTLMDVVVKAGAFARSTLNATGVPDDCLDPAPNATSAAAGTTVGVCAILGGGHEGDTMELDLRDPNGATVDSVRAPYLAPFGLQWYFTNLQLGTAPGAWTIDVRVDGLLARTVNVTVP